MNDFVLFESESSPRERVDSESKVSFCETNFMNSGIDNLKSSMA